MAIYSGIKVLEIADEKGMFCGKLLAAMGADVIKIEHPEGDASRRKGPFAKDAKSPENSLPFIYFNTGKKDITLDIFSEKGRKIFIELIKNTDVLIETLDPWRLKSVDLGYESLKVVNPRLIMLSITPFGQYGPHSDWKADSDIITDAMSGLMSTVGYGGQAPLHLGYDIHSCAASMYGLFGVQVAYQNRLHTGEGTHIDVSLQECTSNWTSQGLGFPQVEGRYVPRRAKTAGGVRQNLVNCKDGFAIVMIGGKWNELLDWFSEEGIDTEVFKDPKYEAHIHEVLTLWDEPLLEAFNKLGSKYNASDFMEEGQRRRIPCAVVSTPAAMINNRQLIERNYFTEIDHPVIGKRIYPGAPIMMTKSPMVIDKPAPLLGQDNAAVYKTIGIDEVQQMKLKDEGII